ncbi:hypothetical protein Ciccas_011762 [Cichlidogyrus casuarinus]|uniref:Fibronectin type-III domain-containing protein n=1 Tax=Cichlidogyrus casuarinus TaxID=1844966 RepID=A0ABD2PQC9_9PLAT
MLRLDIGKVPENLNPMPDLAILYCREHDPLSCKAEKFHWKKTIFIENIEACTVYTIELKVVVFDQVYIFSKDSVNFIVYSWTPAAVAVDTRTLTHTISSVEQIDLDWTNPNSTLPKNCQQNTLIEYYAEGFQNTTKNITTQMTQLKLVDLTIYQFYFVRFTTNISSKLRSNETSQSVSSSWIKVGLTAPGGKVTNLRFEQTNAREAKLLWQRPEVQNGPIDGYQVEDMRKQSKFSTRESSIKVNGLEPCSAYTFYVFAFNNGTERGIGGGNGPKNSLELYLVFAPVKIETQEYKGRVDITWEKPIGCKSEYWVYIDDEKIGETEKEFFTVNDLEGNKTHTLQIAAQVANQIQYSDYKFFDVAAYREFLW